ncbi:hypothetical protein Hanom_Chr04g00340831 [Helianthus anomalus]
MLCLITLSCYYQIMQKSITNNPQIKTQNTKDEMSKLETYIVCLTSRSLHIGICSNTIG